MDYLQYRDYLAHHGILGQKWGIRRYQNPDGTWTDAGKKRYGQSAEEAKTNLQTSRKESRQAAKNAIVSNITNFGFKRQREIAAKDSNAWNTARADKYRDKHTYKLAKMQEKGKSQEKIDAKRQKYELKEAQRDAWVKAVNEANNSYAKSSTIRAAVLGQYDMSVSVAKSAGLSKGEAVLSSILLGPATTMTIAQISMHHQIKREFNGQS